MSYNLLTFERDNYLCLTECNECATEQQNNRTPTKFKHQPIEIRLITNIWSFWMKDEKKSNKKWKKTLSNIRLWIEIQTFIVLTLNAQFPAFWFSGHEMISLTNVCFFFWLKNFWCDSMRLCTQWRNHFTSCEHRWA